MSGVLPAPNPEPIAGERRLSGIAPVAPAYAPESNTPRPSPWSTLHSSQQKAVIVAFALAGALGALLNQLFTAPEYAATARIEVRPGAQWESGFVATQAKLLESSTLARRAALRVSREHPGTAYHSSDRLAALRGNPIARWLPASNTYPRVPAQVEIETYGGARVLGIRAISSDATYAARFSNALASEYILLAGARREGTQVTAETANWPEIAARFVDAAEVPQTRQPASYWPLLWGALAGLAAGLVVLSRRGNAIPRMLRKPGDLRRMRIRELGVIPAAHSVPDAVPMGDQQTFLQSVLMSRRPVNLPAETAVWQDQASLVAEAFRGAAASLLLTKDRARPQVITITSAHRGEGKTTVVLNLAAALADLNLRVLVVDADLRNPRLHQILSLPNSWGLSDLLQERIALRDAPVEALVRTCAIPNLSVVCSGPPALNVASLLYGDRMEQLIARFRRDFDAILIDTPPALLLSDARLSARLSDALVLVVQSGRTSEGELAQLRDRLNDDGISLAGAVLNGWHYGIRPARTQGNGHA